MTDIEVPSRVEKGLVMRGEYAFDVAVSGPEGGRPVLLLHGFPQTCASWDAVTPTLARAGLRCYAMSQRGYSVNARPADTDAYAMHELVADALAVADHLNPDGPVDVVGHDWGASVAWHLASQRREKVRSLTAVSVPHLAAYGHGVRNDPEQQAMIGYMADLRADADVAGRLLADNQAGLREFVGDRLPKAALDRYLEVLGKPEGLRAAIAWYRANGRATHGLPTVAVPTTFIWGTDDVFIARASARKCAEHVSSEYRYVELDGVSHWVPEEAPDVVAFEILRRLLTT